MRTHVIAFAISIGASTACSGEMAQRPATKDPTSAAAAEAPFHEPPAYEPDPLLANTQESSPTPSVAEVFTCPMHPEVSEPRAGTCPKCGMALVPRKHTP